MTQQAQGESQPQREHVALVQPLDALGSSLPIDERKFLSELSPDEVPPWADAQVRAYRKRLKEIESHISTYCSLRNTQASIHVLPPEILGRIFAHACTTRRSLWITQVCRHWRAIATRTPRFWANALDSGRLCARLESEQDFLRIALVGSGTLSLRLSMVDGFGGAWKHLAAHASRMVSVTILVNFDHEVTALETTLSSGSLQNLRTLRVLKGRLRVTTVTTMPRLSLQTRYLPRLRELRIPGGLLSSASTVSTLEHFAVHGRMHNLNKHDLARSLKRCTTLTLLELNNILRARWVEIRRARP
ncbi:hypothetical protein C8Q80DRAFT_640218 [Daedaleopsis nitida]|nr:hypothetical protein C8Q80DRAFT_640218 [Daedaleopsis nitida]